MDWFMPCHGTTAPQGNTSPPSSSTATFLAIFLIYDFVIFCCSVFSGHVTCLHCANWKLTAWMPSRIQPDMFSRTSFCQEKVTQNNALRYLLDHLVWYNVCTPITCVTLSQAFQPNALIFKPDQTHDDEILEEKTQSSGGTFDG